MYDKSFAERLGFCVKKMGGLNRASSLTGTSLPTIGRWKDGGDPKMSNLVAFANAADVSLDWLITGKDNSSNISSAATRSASANDEYYKSVPIYDLAASAGRGRLVADEDVKDHLNFPNWWFEERNLSYNNIVALYAKGDSMTPTIPDNALLLIDQSKTYLSDGKVYVLRLDDGLYVKRVQRMPLVGGVQLISDNKEYKTIDLSKELLTQENFFQVIGQVVHIGIDLPH